MGARRGGSPVPGGSKREQELELAVCAAAWETICGLAAGGRQASAADRSDG